MVGVVGFLGGWVLGWLGWSKSLSLSNTASTLLCHKFMHSPVFTHIITYLRHWQKTADFSQFHLP